MQQESLSRAVAGQSLTNWPAIIQGFLAKGIPEHDIRPQENVFTYHAWRALGWQVRRGEHGVKAVTFVAVKDSKEDVDGIATNDVDGTNKRKDWADVNGFYPPSTVVISPTMKCDLKCYGCYAGDYGKSLELSLDELDSILMQMKEMGMQIAADGGEFFGIAVDAFDGGHVCYPVTGEVDRDLVEGENSGPFGLMRMPGRSRVQGRVAVSAGIAPGAAQIKSFSAIGSKSARKCTELLLTRIACSDGSIPT
jgi:hypothetical protein